MKVREKALKRFEELYLESNEIGSERRKALEGLGGYKMFKLSLYY